MTPVDPPTRLAEPPPPELSRLGVRLHWWAAAQGQWPPRPPTQPRTVELTAGSGLDAGRAEADALADGGADLLMVEGPPPTVAALVVICAVLDLEPIVAVGTSTDAGWAARLTAVRDRLPAARHLLGEPERLADDPLLGRAAGLLAQSAVRRTPVILGSSSALAAAALLAERLAPGAVRWWMAADAPADNAGRLAHADLALDPLLGLGLTGPGAARLAADLLVGGTRLLAT